MAVLLDGVEAIGEPDRRRARGERPVGLAGDGRATDASMLVARIGINMVS
jgi:hypothetical protein